MKSGKIMKVKAENGTNGTSEVENESDDAKEAEVSSTGKTGKGRFFFFLKGMISFRWVVSSDHFIFTPKTFGKMAQPPC